MPENNIADLLTVQQAIQLIDSVPVTPRVVSVPLDQSAGLRLASDLSADRDYPPFKKSLMDGYAVRTQDVASGQAELRVIGTIAAGQNSQHAIAAGETMAIMTGAPLPAGADGVIPVEDVAQRVPAGQNVHILRATSPTRHIAMQGSDCVAGQTVLKTGTLIGPAQIAVAAGIGAATIQCFARPRVAIIGTGDEIVPIGATPNPSQIRDSNTPMLAALLRRLGCDVAAIATTPDDPAAIRQTIQTAMIHDAIFITGGMSMGEFDYVPKILVELGVDLKITKLRIKPGKPFVFGIAESPGFRVQGSANPNLNPEPRTLNPCFVFGLPGNPVSAFVCTLRFTSRLLTRMAGGTVRERWLEGRLDGGLPPNGPREFYQPAIWTPPTGPHGDQSELPTITPLGWKGSADLFTLAAANSLIVRAENEPAMSKGTVVRVLEI